MSAGRRIDAEPKRLDSELFTAGRQDVSGVFRRESYLPRVPLQFFVQSWDLIQFTHTLGDRRDSFLAPHDPWEVIRIVVEGRKRREIDPTLAFLRDCATALQKDSETPPEVRERIVAQMEFFETLTVWYDSIKNLPRKTLMKMMRLGQKIAKVIGE